MIAGRGHAKGAAYERTLARQLSAWLTRGKDDRALWRSVGSGAHASRWNGRQTGDISAVATDDPLVARFSALIVVEAKCYHHLSWGGFLGGRGGDLAHFWEKVQAEAAAIQRVPWLIAKTNQVPALVVMPPPPESRCEVEIHRLQSILDTDPEVVLDYATRRARP